MSGIAFRSFALVFFLYSVSYLFMSLFLYCLSYFLMSLVRALSPSLPLVRPCSVFMYVVMCVVRSLFMYLFISFSSGFVLFVCVRHVFLYCVMYVL